MTINENKKQNKENRIFTAMFLAPFILIWMGIGGYAVVDYVREKKAEQKEIEKAKENKKQSEKSLSFAFEYSKQR